MILLKAVLFIVFGFTCYLLWVWIKGLEHIDWLDDEEKEDDKW